MPSFPDLAMKPFQQADIASVTAIMTRAFDEDTRLHLGEPEGGPPGYDDGRFLIRYALDVRSTAYKIQLGPTVVGAVILWIDSAKQEGYLGTIFLDLDQQNQGLGLAVWQWVESAYPDLKIWRTETPVFSHRNHHFYVNRCGFHIVRIENPQDWREGSYHLEKRASWSKEGTVF